MISEIRHQIGKVEEAIVALEQYSLGGAKRRGHAPASVKRRGRPPGSKNRPEAEGAQTMAAVG